MSFSFETILGIIFFIVFFILPAFSKKKGAPEDEAAPKPPTAKPGGEAEPGRPVAPAPAQPQRAQGQARASTAGQGAPNQQAPKGRGPLTAGSIEEALEEIRARVREAQMQEDAGRPTAPVARKRQQAQAQQQPPQPSGQLVKGDAGGSLVSGEARHIGDTGSRVPKSSLGREGGAAAPGRAPAAGARQSSLGREGVSAPIEVSRRSRDRTRRTTSEITDSPVPGARKAGALPPGAPPAARLTAPVLATDRSSLISGMIWHEVLSEPAAKRRLRRTRSRHL